MKTTKKKLIFEEQVTCDICGEIIKSEKQQGRTFLTFSANEEVLFEWFIGNGSTDKCKTCCRKVSEFILEKLNELFISERYTKTPVTTLEEIEWCKKIIKGEIK